MNTLFAIVAMAACLLFLIPAIEASCSLTACGTSPMSGSSSSSSNSTNGTFSAEVCESLNTYWSCMKGEESGCSGLFGLAISAVVSTIETFANAGGCTLSSAVMASYSVHVSLICLLVSLFLKH